MLVYDIALSMIHDIGPRRGRHLIDTLGSAEAAFKTDAEDIAQICELPFKVIDNLINNSVFPDAEAEIKFIEANGIRAIPLNSPEYPQMLKECLDAPLVLYVKGNIDFNIGTWISIVGTRKFTGYGKAKTNTIVDELAALCPDVNIVSGLAYGTDITAHLAALKNGVKTVAVLGNPLSWIYPENHTSYAQQIIDSGGAIVSEFNTKDLMGKCNFLKRNRIIAGLSSGTVIIESAYKGGSLSTAACAFGYNRDVMAVPGRDGDEMSAGTNALIHNNKAALVTNGLDILGAMNIEFCDTENQKVQEQKKLSFDEQEIIDLLKEHGALSYDELSTKSGMASSQISFLTFTMEMSDLIRILPGNRVERV